MCWPLTGGLARDVPGDLGDALLNMWILGWGAAHLPDVLTGRMTPGAFANANIFHPEPLALSFSEHLFGQVLQILPVYHLTGNLILSYNLLFLSSFVLSGLGLYLLVRDLLGDRPYAREAAFVAGVIYAFVPLRIAQVAHIQSVSSQWMPFALYGFRRYLVGGRPRALAGGTAALLMQNWSCGYYLIFFAPFVLLFVVHQVVSRGRAREPRVWAALAAAAAVVALGTLPVALLYAEGQRLHGIERSTGEVIRYSADVFSYLTAPEALRLWGPIVQAYPKPEGELFLGFVPVGLLVLGVLGGLRARWRRGPAGGAATPLLRAAGWLLTLLIAVQLLALAALLVTGGFVTTVMGIPIRATNPVRLAAGLALLGTLLIAVFPRARRELWHAARSPLALAVCLAALAAWLSLGPVPQSGGRALPGLGLYGLLYDHVPGFDGLRVPARYAMVAAVFLAMAAAYGAAIVIRRTSRPRLTAVALTGLVLIESAFAPMSVNQTWGDGEVTPPARVEPGFAAPAVYRALATLPDAEVVAEFPFGDPAWELRAVYYATVHWKRLVNGYSGAFPQGYKVRVAHLQRVAEAPDAAWDALRSAGTTHVIVHRAAYRNGAEDTIIRWLAERHAHEVGRFGDDILYALSQGPGPRLQASGARFQASGFRLQGRLQGPGFRFQAPDPQALIPDP